MVEDGGGEELVRTNQHLDKPVKPTGSVGPATESNDDHMEVVES